MFGGVAGPFAEFVEQPGSEVLKRPADSMLAGEGDSQPGGEQGGEDGRGHEGVLLEFGVSQLRQANSARSTASQRSFAKS